MTPDQLKMWQAMDIGPVFTQKTVGFTAQSSPENPPGHPESSGTVPVAAMNWQTLEQTVALCQACNLSKTRKQTVFGAGIKDAQLMIIGEAPGAEEDAKGEPFVGQAGKLLDQMLHSLQMSRHKNVYIANVVKCRPPANRNPEIFEISQCADFLDRQVTLVRPKVLLLAGKIAITRILGKDGPVSGLRGKIHTVKVGEWEGPAIVTYHPAYLLRSLTEKAKAWEDMCLLRQQLGF